MLGLCYKSGELGKDLPVETMESWCVISDSNLSTRVDVSSRLVGPTLLGCIALVGKVI